MTSVQAEGRLAGYFLEQVYSEAANALLRKAQSLFEPSFQPGVDLFYTELMAYEPSRPYLTTQLVQTRLQSSLQAWLRQVLSPQNETSLAQLIRYQTKVGEVHARINIPMSLVANAMMLIKHHFFEVVYQSDWSQADKADLVVLIDRILMASLTMMDEAYFKGTMSNERVAQEYRSHVSAHDVALEIERVKSSLYAWFSQFVSAGLISQQPVEAFIQTDFGLWVTHKLDMFCTKKEKTSHLKALVNQMHALSQQVVQGELALTQALEPLQQAMSESVYLLDLVSQQALMVSGQRDSLTKLIERRFMVPILQKETQLALQLKQPYCLMLIDIDDFKRINDVYGHPAGDKVLEEVGKLLRQGLRLSDYPFRYGGEELLVLLPETRLTTAVELAEALRSLIAARSIKLESERHIAVTVSIGVAQFFDHPDYHRLIELADQKLYEAKRSGKNRVCF